MCMDRGLALLEVSITSVNWRGQLYVKAMNWDRQSAKVFARMKLKSAQRRMELLYQNKLMPEERGEAGLLCNDKCWFPPRYLKWFDPVILLNHRQEMINVLLMRPLHFISHSPCCRIAQDSRGACFCLLIHLKEPWAWLNPNNAEYRKKTSMCIPLTRCERLSEN